MNKQHQFVLTVLMPGIILSYSSCERENITDSPSISIDSVNIGLYMGDAVFSGLRTPTLNIVEQLGYSYTILTNDSIIQGIPDHYSVLILPAGTGGQYWENLGQTGFDNIVEYVNRGGGYIGICGSAYLAAVTDIFRGWSGEPRRYEAHDGLGIFAGTTDGPAEEFAPSYRDDNCKINIIDHTHPVTYELPDTITYVYDHGPEFLPDDKGQTTIIGESVKGGHSFIIATEFNHGRVFLTSGHPEMANNETNRKLLRNAVTWCSKLNP
ncbi:MAG: ThuA domain-containing protein [Bacteroidales bacterium]|nr:ThuA domain-containing protein [Bacteroidales bacterium]